MLHIGLVGATNVGKSTLFNRLIGQFRAIVTDIPGTTTDIIRHETQLPGIGQAMFLDSPGLADFHQERPFIQYIIDHSDLILFIIDDAIGYGSKEQEILQYIMRAGKKNNAIVIANKLDIKRKEREYATAIADYYSLGFPGVVGVSALKEIALHEIQDAMQSIVDKTPALQKKLQKEAKKSSVISFAVVGKPNAGKSTLLNTFVGSYVSKVEDKAGTTRDYIESSFVYDGKKYTIFDTAGIKRIGHMHGIEKIAYTKTKDMLEYTRPVVVFMIDATEGVTHRDMTLIKEVYNLALPMLICLNKIDLLTEKQQDYILRQTKAKFDFATYIPIVPIVATTGQGNDNIMKMVAGVHKEATKRIDTGELNRIITKDLISRPPRFPKNKICKIFYVTQVDINAPTFIVFVNYVQRANFAFKKWIDNTIRKYFGFIGVPIVIRFKARERREYEEYKLITDRNKKKSLRNEETGKKISWKHRKTNEQQRKDNIVSSDKAKNKATKHPDDRMSMERPKGKGEVRGKSTPQERGQKKGKSTIRDRSGRKGKVVKKKARS